MKQYLRRGIKHIEVRGGRAEVRYEERPGEQDELVIVESDPNWNERTTKPFLGKKVLELTGPDASRPPAHSTFGGVENIINGPVHGGAIQAGHISGGVTVPRGTGKIQIAGETVSPGRTGPSTIVIKLRQGTSLKVKHL
ncbi:MAG TPA: hypothetical protein VD907_03865 [Verrucomicrobiae bacterium]|nr:hypothetical protein [Verrucomicrobiae bacterium]